MSAEAIAEAGMRVTLLWTLLVTRVVRGQQTPTEQTAHRVCAARGRSAQPRSSCCM